MKATVEKLERNKVLLKIELEQERVSQAIDKAFRKLVKEVNIPGFRKGKIPRGVFDRFIGKEVLYEEAAENLIPEAYYDAVKDTGIEPIDQPEIDVVQIEDGKEAIFNATVEVKPEVQLGQYKGLEVTRKIEEVKDEDVDKEIEGLRQNYAKLVPVEDGKVENGDTVILDYSGFVDEVQFKGGTAQEQQLEIGSGSFIPGFEEQLIGFSVGETHSINVTFPEDYFNEDLAGKEAVFDVAVKSIKRKEYADIDDEFAKDVSEFETLGELKEDILHKLKKVAEDDAEQKVRRALIEKAVENSEVEIPETMIKNQVQQMLGNLETRLSYQGVSLADYLKYSGSDEETLQQQMHDDAEKIVKADLVLDTITSDEGFDASEEEVTEEVNKMAEQYKQEPDAMRKMLEAQGNLNMIEQSIKREKTVGFLVEHAKITD
ncbi:MAG TPA: trigger factor [Clostridia bacterium]|nr:trigger factor [Clostridia bacterium]